MKNTYNKLRGIVPQGYQSVLKDLLVREKKEEQISYPDYTSPQRAIYNGSITLLMHGTGFSASRSQYSGQQYLTLQVGTSDKKIRIIPNDFKVEVQPMKFIITSVKGTKQSLGSVIAMIEKSAPYNPNTKTGLPRREVPVVPKSKSTSKGGATKK